MESVVNKLWIKQNAKSNVRKLENKVKFWARHCDGKGGLSVLYSAESSYERFCERMHEFRESVASTDSADALR
jgi:hypothetical protein